jgi:hypothetical protein
MKSMNYGNDKVFTDFVFLPDDVGVDQENAVKGGDYHIRYTIEVKETKYYT